MIDSTEYNVNQCSFIKEIIDSNKSFLKEINFPKNATLLGSGAFGEVFDLEYDNLVIKFSFDKSNATKSALIVDKHVDNVCKVFDVVEGKSGVGKLWFITMEKLYRPNLISVREATRNFYNKVEKKYVDKKMSQEGKEIFNQIKNGYLNLKKLGINHIDVHINNVMMDENKTYKLIDIM